MDPATMAMAGASLISGMSGNKSAQDAANRASAEQAGIRERAERLYDTLYSGAERADQGGQFNYAHQLAMEKATGERALGVAQRSLASAGIASGAHASDTNQTQGQDALSTRFAQEEAQRATGLQQQGFWDRQKAYGTAGEALGGLNMAENNALGQQQMDYSRMTSPAAMIGSMMPFFSKKPSTGDRRSPAATFAGQALRY